MSFNNRSYKCVHFCTDYANSISSMCLYLHSLCQSSFPLPGPRPDNFTAMWNSTHRVTLPKPPYACVVGAPKGSPLECKYGLHNSYKVRKKYSGSRFGADQ